MNQNILTNKSISDIRELISEKEFIDEEVLEDLKENYKSISTSDVKLAVLFMKCHDILEINSSQFKDEEKDFSNKIKSFLKQYQIQDLRSLVNSYGFGKEYGDYIAEINIKQIINSKREDYLELIRVFFRIFGEEE